MKLLFILATLLAAVSSNAMTIGEIPSGVEIKLKEEVSVVNIWDEVYGVKGVEVHSNLDCKLFVDSKLKSNVLRVSENVVHTGSSEITENAQKMSIDIVGSNSFYSFYCVTYMGSRVWDIDFEYFKKSFPEFEFTVPQVKRVNI